MFGHAALSAQTYGKLKVKMVEINSTSDGVEDGDELNPRWIVSLFYNNNTLADTIQVYDEVNDTNTHSFTNSTGILENNSYKCLSSMQIKLETWEDDCGAEDEYNETCGDDIYADTLSSIITFENDIIGDTIEITTSNDYSIKILLDWTLIVPVVVEPASCDSNEANVSIENIGEFPDREGISWINEGGAEISDIYTPTIPLPDINTLYYAIIEIGSCAVSSEAFELNPFNTNIDTTFICIGQSVTLSAPEGDSYLWGTTGSDAQEIEVSPEENTNYPVTIRSGICSYSLIATVIVNPLPTASIEKDTIGICMGDSVTINLTPPSMTDSYLWSTGDTTNSLNITSMPDTTDYSVIITSNEGCIAYDTVAVVAHPIPEANPTTLTACDENTFNLTDTRGEVSGFQPNVEVNYYIDEQLINLISDSLSYAGTHGQEIYAQVVNAAECDSVQIVTLNIVDAIIVPSVTFSSDTLCTGGEIISASLDSGSGFDYSWSADNVRDTTGMDGGCTIFKLLENTASVELQLEVSLGDCIEDSTYTFSLSPDLSSQVIHTQPSNTLVCVRNDFDAYQWGYDDATTFCSTTLNGEIYQDYIVGDSFNNDTIAKHYWVLIEKDSCQAKIYYNSPFQKIVQPEIIDYGDISMQVLPNPNKGVFDIKLIGNENSTSRLFMFDMMGRKIYEERINKNSPEYYVNLSFPELASGMYVIRLIGNGDIDISQKIIIK